MSANAFDLILIGLTLVLGLKGTLTGFRRELFGFVGLIGGVFIASRAADPLARLVEANLFRLSNPAAMRLILFVAVLTLVWGGISMLGRAVESRSYGAAPSPLSRAGGFLLAAGKYFLIFSIILAALYQTPMIRKKLQSRVEGSLLFPLLRPLGKTLIHLPAPALGKPRKPAGRS
jgi:membrane protein required for colicin V production